jgi:hypothetical protein
MNWDGNHRGIFFQAEEFDTKSHFRNIGKRSIFAVYFLSFNEFWNMGIHSNRQADMLL